MSLLNSSHLNRGPAAPGATEALFRAMWEQTGVGVVLVDAEGALLMPNPGYCQILGYSVEEIEGKTVREVTHPGDYEPEATLTRRMMAGEIPGYSVEKRLCRADGSLVWATMTATPVRLDAGAAPLAMSLVEDISERKRAEAALRQSEERYRAIVEQATAGIALADGSGLFVEVNDYFASMLGFGADELKTLRVQDVTHPDDWPLDAQKWAELARQGTPFVIEKRYKRKDGAFVWGRVSVSAVRGQDGAPPLFCAVMVDVSAQKEAQAALVLANGELEARVENRTRELEVALETVRRESTQREQAERGRDRLLRQIVGAQEEERRRVSRELHDNMGQHLTAILLFLNALQLKNAALPFDDRRLSEGGLGGLRGMVDELLTVSHRLAWEIRPALLDNVGLRAALEQYVARWSHGTSIKADFVARGVGARTALSPDAETALFRVAQEALINVQRHSGASQVSVLLEESEEGAAVIIEDNGRGVDLQNLDYSSRLGLLGMKERLELVGGTLTLESSEGAGLTVYARVSPG